MSSEETEKPQINDVNTQIETLKKSIESDPDNPEKLANLGVLYSSINRYEEALNLFRSILEKDPKNVEAHKYLGVIYAQIGKLDEAISELEIAVKLKADSPSLWNNLSEAYRRSKNFHQANVARMRAIQLSEIPKKV
ncbi:MAG: tetratricopeptide repeat protein [Candidatus Lokiarchaeota archaeon]|nr:tetratricopeptide repeat protein [Candidatus Lokiarchaeota archaeon]